MLMEVLPQISESVVLSVEVLGRAGVHHHAPVTVVTEPSIQRDFPQPGVVARGAGVAVAVVQRGAVLQGKGPSRFHRLVLPVSINKKSMKEIKY